MSTRWSTGGRLVLLSATTLLTVVSGSALATVPWGTTGSGSAAARSGAITAPGAPTVPASTVTNGNVAVSWSGATGPALTYFVERLVGSTPTAVCSSTFALPITATSCTDSGVPVGSYRYRITTRVGAAWRAVSTESAVVVVTAPAAVAVSTPDLDPASDSGSSQADNVTAITTLTFTGTATPGSTVKILAGATVVAVGSATSGGVYTLTTSSLTGGAGTVHTVSATATVGTTSATSPGALAVTIDTQGPQGLTSSCAFTSGSNYTCSGAAGNGSNDSATVTLTVRAGATTSAGPSAITRTAALWTSAATGLNNNTEYVGTVVQVDLAGNSSSSASGVFRR